MTPGVLAISSHVTASTVGLRASVPALEAHGVEAWPVPTVLFGLHPGWGGARGQALSAAELTTQLEDVLRHPDAGRLGWILTGHLSGPGQVAAAADAIAAFRAAAPGLKVCVDPIMGDAGRGLYIDAHAARAIAVRLTPLADLVTPNAWEAERLSGVAVSDPASALAAAAALGRPAALITSVRARDRIGAVYVDAGHALFAHAPERAEAPNGTGDLLAAAFLGATVTGAAPAEALLDSVRRVEGALAAAAAAERSELPAAAIARGAAGPAKIEAIPR